MAQEEKATRKCSNCGKLGHYRTSCPDLSEKEKEAYRMAREENKKKEAQRARMAHARAARGKRPGESSGSLPYIPASASSVASASVSSSAVSMGDLGDSFSEMNRQESLGNGVAVRISVRTYFNGKPSEMNMSFIFSGDKQKRDLPLNFGSAQKLNEMLAQVLQSEVARQRQQAQQAAPVPAPVPSQPQIPNGLQAPPSNPQFAAASHG